MAEVWIAVYFRSRARLMQERARKDRMANVWHEMAFEALPPRVFSSAMAHQEKVNPNEIICADSLVGMMSKP